MSDDWAFEGILGIPEDGWVLEVPPRDHDESFIPGMKVVYDTKEDAVVVAKQLLDGRYDEITITLKRGNVYVLDDEEPQGGE